MEIEDSDRISPHSLTNFRPFIDSRSIRSIEQY